MYISSKVELSNPLSKQEISPFNNSTKSSDQMIRKKKFIHSIGIFSRNERNTIPSLSVSPNSGILWSAHGYGEFPAEIDS